MTTLTTSTSLMSFIGTHCETAHIGDYYVAVTRDHDDAGEYLVAVFGYTPQTGFTIRTGLALPVQGSCLSAWVDTDILPDDDHIDYEDVVNFIGSVVG